jgi:hypothetical protein
MVLFNQLPEPVKASVQQQDQQPVLFLDKYLGLYVLETDLNTIVDFL